MRTRADERAPRVAEWSQVGRDLEESYGKPGRLYKVALRATADNGLARRTVDALAAARHNATLLRGWNDVLPLPLHWGEVLALSFVANASASTAPSPRRLAPRLVTLGLPLSRYNFSSAVAGGFRRMGRDLGAFLEAQTPSRVALLVSTDLAHTHWANTSFGFSPHE